MEFINVYQIPTLFTYLPYFPTWIGGIGAALSISGTKKALAGKPNSNILETISYIANEHIKTLREQSCGLGRV